MARSLNKVILIGNLTRDPEMRYTPAGTAVCTIGLATNRAWKTESGENKEEVEFHKLVVWDKLAEICSQMLKKGTRAYFEGRIQSRKWTGNDNVERTSVEIVISDMIILDSKKTESSSNFEEAQPTKVASKKAKDSQESVSQSQEEVDENDIPF